jgi:hypothetical protein
MLPDGKAPSATPRANRKRIPSGKQRPPCRIESRRFGTFDWTKLNICPIFVLTIGAPLTETGCARNFDFVIAPER